jgi:cytochrome c-type biogenesis protein CcmH/NrfF
MYGRSPVLRCAALALLLALAAPARSAELDVEAARRAHRVAASVMSPFCPGRTLADCPSPDAAALRQDVRALLDAGASEEEVRQRLEARFGEEVTALPKSALAWLLPIAILDVGAAALALALVRLARPARVSASLPLDPALEAALDAEIEREIARSSSDRLGSKMREG